MAFHILTIAAVVIAILLVIALVLLLYRRYILTRQYRTLPQFSSRILPPQVSSPNPAHFSFFSSTPTLPPSYSEADNYKEAIQRWRRSPEPSPPELDNHLGYPPTNPLENPLESAFSTEKEDAESGRRSQALSPPDHQEHTTTNPENTVLSVLIEMEARIQEFNRNYEDAGDRGNLQDQTTTSSENRELCILVKIEGFLQKFVTDYEEVERSVNGSYTAAYTATLRKLTEVRRWIKWERRQEGRQGGNGRETTGRVLARRALPRQGKP